MNMLIGGRGKLTVISSGIYQLFKAAGKIGFLR